MEELTRLFVDSSWLSGRFPSPFPTLVSLSDSDVVLNHIELRESLGTADRCASVAFYYLFE